MGVCVNMGLDICSLDAFWRVDAGEAPVRLGICTDGCRDMSVGVGVRMKKCMDVCVPP